MTAAIPLGLRMNAPPAATMLGGLIVFGVMFALNSSVHSYLVLAYSENMSRINRIVAFGVNWPVCRAACWSPYRFQPRMKFRPRKLNL